MFFKKGKRQNINVNNKKEKPDAETFEVPDNFETQENLYRFNPTIHFCELDRMLALGKEFIELKTDTTKIFYVWGHSYEMDIASENWVKLEEFFKLVSNKDDIFYGTNKEVLL